MTFAFRFAARSDVGRVRSKNDDSGYAGHYLAVVADGMGGHVGGDVASATTVLDLTPLDRAGFEGPAGIYLVDEVVNANIIINELVDLNPMLAGMGTTCTALLIDGEQIELAHVGDSRAYRLRQDVFEQMTTDHTFVQRLLQEGRITPEEAENHPHRNVIMRVLGDVDASPEMDVQTLPAQVGEKWLLSSDGLDAVVSLPEIEAVLRSTGDLQQIVDQLVDLALERGAPDNVTVVALSVIEEASLSEAITAPQPLIPVRPYALESQESKDAPGQSQESASGQTSARPPWRRRLPDHAKLNHALRQGQWRGESFSDNVLNTMSVKAGVDSPEVEEAGAPTPASVLRQELASRPHQLVGAAVNATQTGMIPAVTARTAQNLATLSRLPDLEPAELPQEIQEALNIREEAPRPSWPLRILVVTMTLLLLALSAWSFHSWLQTRYYVGIKDGQVTVYQGLAQNLGPIPLHSVVEQTDIAVESLPAFSRSLLENNIEAESRKEAEQIVQNLRDQPSATQPVTPGQVTTASPAPSQTDSLPVPEESASDQSPPPAPPGAEETQLVDSTQAQGGSGA